VVSAPGRLVLIGRSGLRLAHAPEGGILLYRKFRKAQQAGRFRTVFVRERELSTPPIVCLLMPVDRDFLPPRYRRPEPIGRGAMSDIFRAEDGELGRTVAVKVLSELFARDASSRARFKREALAAARLSGEPSTVTIFDVGEWDERPFIVMEYLPGGSLEERLRSGRPSTGETLTWLEQAALALDSAHRNGVVHRDVKPGNLLLDRDGALKVADFGIASAAGTDSLTMTGTVLGTAGYLSPEQAQGERATAASDRYALAVLAFELLTGRRPFESESATEEAAAHVTAPIPSACRGTALPREVDPVFERGLAKDPAERFDSAVDFVAALREALRAGAGATHVLAPVGAGGRRNPSLLLVALFAAAAVLGGAGLAAMLSGGEGSAAKTTTAPQTAAPPPARRPPPPPPPPAANSDGTALTDEATRQLRAGDYAGAERLARQAVSALSGSGQLYEAYAEYDLGAALARLGRCDEALQHLDRSQEIQGERVEIDAARSLCTQDEDENGKGKAKGKKKKGGHRVR
jgi:tetratricopeptide (TPR) repeat protein